MVGLTLPVAAPDDLPGPVVGAPVLSLATAAGLTIIMVAAVGVSGLSGPFMRNDLVRWRLPSMLYRPWYPRSLEPTGKAHRTYDHLFRYGHGGRTRQRRLSVHTTRPSF